jgi:hypothetical protein
MSSHEIAAQIQSRREQAICPFENIDDLNMLEALRDVIVGNDKMLATLDDLILERKREAMGDALALECVADLYDKSAAPLALAFPVLIAVVGAEALVPTPLAHWLSGASYLLGATLWVVMRILSLRTAKHARLKLARLGKVD